MQPIAPRIAFLTGIRTKDSPVFGTPVIMYPSRALAEAARRYLVEQLSLHPDVVRIQDYVKQPEPARYGQRIIRAADEPMYGYELHIRQLNELGYPLDELLESLGAQEYDSLAALKEAMNRTALEAF